MNPLRPALDRIARGFTIPQKIGLTIAGVFYVICPFDFDFIPLLGWVDDGMVIYLMTRLWAGPTLPRLNGGGAASASHIGRLLRHHANEFAQGFKEGSTPK